MPQTQDAVRKAADPNLFQQMQTFTVARDLAADLEAWHDTYRHPVLIELTDPTLEEPPAAILERAKMPTKITNPGSRVRR